MTGNSANVAGMLDQALFAVRCDRIVEVSKDVLLALGLDRYYVSKQWRLWLVVVRFQPSKGKVCSGTQSDDIGPENRDEAVVPSAIDEDVADQV